MVDKENRVHCSLNLNTETGRLSSRKPNLQNQPALEKDQYKIRTLQIICYFQERVKFYLFHTDSENENIDDYIYIN